LRSGRTDEQHKEIMLNIMEDVSRISGIPVENVWVYLCKLAPSDMVEYGRVLPKPGEEQQWFASLPLALRTQLESLGVHEEKFHL
jgi:hypothetical protein